MTIMYNNLNFTYNKKYRIMVLILIIQHKIVMIKWVKRENKNIDNKI